MTTNSIGNYFTRIAVCSAQRAASPTSLRDMLSIVTQRYFNYKTAFHFPEYLLKLVKINAIF